MARSNAKQIAIGSLSHLVGVIAMTFLLTGCSKPSHLDYTELLFSEDRSLGQDPPDWTILRSGELAYMNTAIATKACSSKDEFLVYNSTGNDTRGCLAVTPGSWVRVQEIEPAGKDKYVITVTPRDVDRPVSYVGAGELSPNIPSGTELLAHDEPDSSSDKSDSSSDSGVDLLNEKGDTIGELLDHTRVRVTQLDPGDGQTETEVAVTVLSGKFVGVNGFLSLDDLVAPTGDDDLDDFLGAQPNV